MRKIPTWRIPFGILSLFFGLIIYGIFIAKYASPILTGLPIWVQTLAYVLLGVVWLLPLKRFLIWMETGTWSPPNEK